MTSKNRTQHITEKLLERILETVESIDRTVDEILQHLEESGGNVRNGWYEHADHNGSE